MPSPSAPSFGTERLRAVPLRPAHAPLLFDALSDDRLYAFIPRVPARSVEDLAARFDALREGRSSDGRERWLNWVLFRKADREPVGMLEATVYEGCSRASIAYTVFTPCQRRGFAREACERLLTLLHSRYDVARVEAYVDTRNTASAALAEAVGMCRVETLKGVDHFKGASSDEHVYRIEFALDRGP